MRILSLNLGRPQIVLRGGRQYSTAIDRLPTTARIRVDLESLAGDRVSNTRVHGGPDKALCAYPHEHYAHFAARLGRELAIPSFGENLTLSGLVETDAAIGDTLRAGEALLQISQPRQPCRNLADKHGRPEMIPWVNETQFCGWYFRVLEPGALAAGDELRRIARPHPDATIAWAMHTLLDPSRPRPALERLAALPELSAAWKEQAERRFAGDGDDD